MNVLEPHEQQSILTLIRAGLSYREIHRRLGFDREAIAKYAEAAGIRSAHAAKPATPEGVTTGSENQNRPPSQGCPPDGGAAKPGVTESACSPFREWIGEQVALGRNAMAIYQELVDTHGFTHGYLSVRRFVGKLKKVTPERYDRLEFLPGEEAQVDYGLGAPTLYPATSHYRKPRLFVMTLRYSRKSFRRVVWNSSKETWARLHEEAFRYFGGVPQYVVLDNLKEGVIKPDLYEPGLNPVYAQMLAHYGVVADPARPGDPDRKGTVENAIQHTQSTALKGKQFESLDEQNAYLEQWEERWAAPRIHGRAKRQVQEMFEEEKKVLQPLPLTQFRYFKDGVRTVQDDGCIEVERSYYFARPDLIGVQVPVRIYELEIEILDPRTLAVARRHTKHVRPGSVSIDEHERIYNPSRQTERLLKQARAIGNATHELCELLFREQGRLGQRRIQGLISLTRKHQAERIEAACRQALERGIRRYRTIRLMLESPESTTPPESALPALVQQDPLIRGASEYESFWDRHAQQEPDAMTVPIQGELNLCP